MNTRYPLFAALLSLFTLVLPLSASGQGPARSQLDAFADGLETLTAGFRQVVIGPDGELQDSSEGQVWLQRPDLFRWEYGGDFPERVIADGRRIWIYDEMLEQVTVKDQAAELSASPLVLLMEPERLDESFEVREVGQADGADLLELRAMSAESEFDRILIAFAANELTLMIVEDAFGLRTEIRFFAMKRNAELDPALFQFVPPEGVDVIGDLPASSDQR